MTNREEFLKRLRETFRVEANEGIVHITSNLIELEKEQPALRKRELVEAIFRDSHSLKGAARAVNFSEIETICQALESVFSELKNETLQLSIGLFDLFHRTVNTLNNLLSLSPEEINESITNQVAELINNLKNAEQVENKIIANENLKDETETSVSEPVSQLEISLKKKKESQSESKKAEKKDNSQGLHKLENTVRISIDKLDNLLTQAEEFLTLKQNFAHINTGLKSISRKLEILQHESTVVSPLLNLKEHNTDNQNNSELVKVAKYFEWSASLIKAIENDLESLRKRAMNESYNSGVKAENLLDEVRSIISVPFSSILDGLPKAARDLSKDIGKTVNVEVVGGEMEIDRRILEELYNPLIHLLRNTIDHGIEKPEIRSQKGKPVAGLIRIVVDRMENNRVEITFSDDGAGVDLEKVKQKYIRYEKIPEKEWDSIDENILLKYLFKSGFSTSELITDISGRGLGLSIVQEKIEQLGGSVSVRTTKDKGTEFKIEIPLSLVTFRGVDIQIGEREFVIPTSKIEKAIRIDKQEIKTIGNKATIGYNNKAIPLVYLSNILEISWKETDNHKLIVLIMGNNNNTVGFVVDAIHDEEVVLVKKFNCQLKRVRNITGATVLGSGKVIPILNVSDLLKSALKETIAQYNEQRVEKEKNSILVVEDSITSRMLLKNILETAGYNVTTAIDGVDGYTRLKEIHADLVISDVDMPRMNGFDMTAKIRSDKAFAEIPVVLVTSLSKREDRERGLEVGANAYIVKSNFDQSNLLEVVERLIG